MQERRGGGRVLLGNLNEKATGPKFGWRGVRFPTVLRPWPSRRPAVS